MRVCVSLEDPAVVSISDAMVTSRCELVSDETDIEDDVLGFTDELEDELVIEDELEP